MIMKLAAVALSLCFAAGSCTKDSAPHQAAPDPAQSKHAAPDAVPGSHEDWCAEHEVPESMCTRCNPSLAAAFEATGDWCEEHGLPKSQCLACDPELKIERPPKPGAK
jgi:hypothetical protein